MRVGRRGWLGGGHADRQPEAEGGATARPVARGMDGAAVQLDDVPHDGQPEAEPAVRPGRAAVGLAEAIEDERQHLGPDALAGVRDHDLDLRADAPDVNLHAAAARRELDRVREQVPHRLLQPLAIAVDARRTSSTTVSTRRPFTCEAGSIVSTAADTTLPRSTSSTSRRSLPEMIRDRSSRSSIRRACAAALRTMASRACAVLDGSTMPDWRICPQPMIALIGVRSSCDNVARNSSFARFAARASA